MSRPDEGIESGTVLLGKYRVDERIGRGGMGLVYRAHHLALDEQVAIKIMRADVRLDDEAVQRFQREAQSAVRLKSEHVARISDVGAFDDGTPYMVMEFLAGADLGSIVDDHGPMAVGDAVDLVLQACDALAEAHSINIVHRDVKPSNLFVTTRPDGAPILKILDFGISKSAHGTDLSLTQTASVLGTPAYMSPEQMRSARHVDGRTDIWSLGTVLYELVEGRRPFMAETFSEMCVMAAADPHEPMRIAPQLEGVIARCLAKSAEERYPTMADLARDLAPFANDPQRSNFYVGRIFRTLGRPMDSRPTPMPRTPTPPPGPNPLFSMQGGIPTVELGRAAPATGPVTMSTVVDRPAPTSRRKLVVAIALLTSAVAIAVVTLASSSQPSATPADAALDEETQRDIVTLPTEPPPIVPPGSAAAAGSARDAAGSAATLVVGSGSAKGNAGGSGKATSRRGSGAISSKRGSAARGQTAVKKGSAAGAGSGSATPPPKKPCNPFESARPCPKDV